MIYLQDVLKQMRQLDDEGKAVPFSITVRTLNKYTGKGGKLNRYPVSRLVMKEKQERITSVQALRTLQPKEIKERKNPNHFINKTRNIRVPDVKNPIKIHIRHIIEFNGQKVIY